MKHVSKFLLDISSNHTEYSKNFTSIITEQEALSNTTDNIFFLSGVRSKSTSRASDKDIASKKYFYIDLDIKKALATQPQFKDIYKLPSEVGNQKVLKYANQVKQLLGTTRLSDWRYIVYTGNGVHVYYVSETALDVGTDITALQYKKWIEMILNEFEGLSNDSFTKSLLSPDRACSNIWRISRLAWSYNHKGAAIKTFILDYQDVYTDKLYGFGEIEADDPSKANSTKPLLPLAPYQANKELLRDYNSYSSMLKHVVPIRSLIPLLNKEYNIKAHTKSVGASIYRDRKTPRVIFVSKFNNLEKNWSQNEWYRLLKDFPSLQCQKSVNVYDIASLVTDWKITNFKNWLEKKGLMEIKKTLDNFDNLWHLEDKKNPFKSISRPLEDTKWHIIPEETQNVNKVPLRAEFDILKKTCKDKQNQKKINKEKILKWVL